MAIILSPPSKKQGTFVIAIYGVLVLVLAVIFLIVFLPEFQKAVSDAPLKGALGGPDIKIKFNALDADQVKNLEPFEDTFAVFNYVVQDKKGRQFIGQISASSKTEAQQILEPQGLVVLSLEEINVGRSNPFASYYESQIKK